MKYDSYFFLKRKNIANNKKEKLPYKKKSEISEEIVERVINQLN